MQNDFVRGTIDRGVIQLATDLAVTTGHPPHDLAELIKRVPPHALWMVLAYSRHFGISPAQVVTMLDHQGNAMRQLLDILPGLASLVDQEAAP